MGEEDPGEMKGWPIIVAIAGMSRDICHKAEKIEHTLLDNMIF